MLRDGCPQLLPGPEEGARAAEAKAWGQGNGMRGLEGHKTRPRAGVAGRALGVKQVGKRLRGIGRAVSGAESGPPGSREGT